jgi:beta-galactosidase
MLLLPAVCACSAYAGPTEARSHVLFDDGWRFSRRRARDAEQAAFDDSTWRVVDLPHDWSIEDLSEPVARRHEKLELLEGEWLFHEGDDRNWKAPDLDDSKWESVTLPDHWQQNSSQEEGAYGWYRKHIVIPAEREGRVFALELGKIHDVDETYLNGELVGRTGAFPPGYKSARQVVRQYRLWRQRIRYGEENVIAVRVYNGGGPGGVYGETAPPVVSGPFNSSSEAGYHTGFTLGGRGRYRKRFTLPAESDGKRVHLQFDGVYMNADVWLNEEHLGEHAYGYTSFWFDMTPHVKWGAENVLAVQVTNRGVNSRWYSGSGIYRHVWLTVMNPVHVAHWGTFVTTPEVSPEAATVRVQTTVQNETGEASAVVLRTTVVDGDGNCVGQHESEAEIPPGGSSEFDQAMAVQQPALWSPDSPALYQAVSKVVVSGEVVDDVATTFGIRSISFDAQEGFKLNGKPMLLRGGCVHHDNGPLGARTYDRAEERRVELMKAAGFNAIRTAHNPPSPGFLDACDRLGMLVIDEAFDQWRRRKTPDDYHQYFDQWWERDIDSFVLRDRNHPCIIMWSTGNEIRERFSDDGVKTSRALAERIKGMDPTRPITSGVNGVSRSGADALFDTLDVCGYNYGYGTYEEHHERVPNRVIYASESSPMFTFETWMATVDNPYVVGDFVWTGYDYLGEASIGWYGLRFKEVFPWTVAYCGDIDLCGFRRPLSYYRGVLWNVGPKVVAFVEGPTPTFGSEMESFWGWPDVRASWTWPNLGERSLRVDAYSACDAVQLLLNGRDLGTKETSRETKFTASWDVPYEPGTLKAVGYEGGEPVAEWELQTAGEPASITLTPDREIISADGQDLCFVTVEVVYAEGVRNPTAENLIWFAVEGAGEIAAVGSGNPTSIESFQQPKRKAFDGRCLLIVKSAGQPGEIRITAQSEGLQSAHLTVAAEARAEHGVEH